MAQHWMYANRPKVLQVITQPVGTLSGLPLLVMPILNALGSNGLLDVSFSANVTATVSSGPGTVTAGGLAVGVLGVITFVGLTISGSGTSTITFSAPGFASVTAQVTIL